MTPRISIDERILQQVLQEGELQVEGQRGVPLVVMTLDARQELERVIYDDSQWTEAELRAAGSEQLADPAGWGAPGMEVYDELYGDQPTDHADNPQG